MTSTRMPASHQPDAETLLASLAGILSVHIVRGPSGQILEIHILSAAALHPKQVVRNVESALRAGLGLEVDRRIISVAQVRTPEQEEASRNGDGPSHGPPPQPPPELAPGPERLSGGRSGSAAPDPGDRRLEFVRYHSLRQEGRCTCQVVLRDDAREVTGSGVGPDTVTGRAQSAARAVLDGICQARPDLRLELDGASLTSSRGRTFVIAAAQLIRGRDVVRLAGAAPLTRSPEEAAILATLQATNRWSG
jgi:hypothetical protein